MNFLRSFFIFKLSFLGIWRSPVAHFVRDDGAAGSNPAFLDLKIAIFFFFRYLSNITGSTYFLLFFLLLNILNPFDEANQLGLLVKDTGLLFGVTHTYTGYPMVKEAKDLTDLYKKDKMKADEFIVKLLQ